jgi:uncharacterized protein (UPF0333 family)
MENNYYGNEYFQNMDKSITKIWMGVALLILASIVSIVFYFLIDSNSKSVIKNIDKANQKIDSSINYQVDILYSLDKINEKLEYNNQMVIDTIMKVNGSVNKVNKSVKEMRSEIDTLIVYIKK